LVSLSPLLFNHKGSISPFKSNLFFLQMAGLATLIYISNNSFDLPASLTVCGINIKY
jgi:hypothetical protein